MNPFDLFVLVAFGALIGLLFGAATLTMVVGNELRAFMRELDDRKPHQLELAAAAATELELRRRDLEASGGRQNDADALSAERLVATKAARQSAANDPGGAQGATSEVRRLASCSFCARIRARAAALLMPQRHRDVAAAKVPAPTHGWREHGN